MRKLKLIISGIFHIFFFYQLLFSQNIIFNPVSDTIKVIDGCTGPVINCTLSASANIDSIKLTPGFNSYIEYIDSLGNWVSTPNCWYLISDSADIYEYELWYIQQGPLPYLQQIPFDSLFYTYDFVFKILLIVTSQGNHVDSLSQLFISEYGLGLNDNGSNFPENPVLCQNYPNPFNSSTIIKYRLFKKSNIKLSVYDVSGKLVKILLNEEQNTGNYSITWSTGNINSGVYFIKLFSDGYTFVKKCILIK